MKRTIIISAVVSSLFLYSTAFAAENLWQFYGGHLPSIRERAQLYSKAGFSGVYTGTLAQNARLLSFLDPVEPMLGTLAQPSSTVEATSTAGWTDDGSTVRLNTASDFVGIGTANPTEKLSVTGGNASVSGDVSLSGGDLNIGGSSGTSTLSSLGGKLGVGSTTPASTFSVQGNQLVSGTSTAAIFQATSTIKTTSLTNGSNVKFTLPTADGSNGASLVTNGSGVLSFTSSAASNDWDQVASTSATIATTSLTMDIPSSSTTGAPPKDIQVRCTLPQNSVGQTNIGMQFNNVTAASYNTSMYENFVNIFEATATTSISIFAAIDTGNPAYLVTVDIGNETSAPNEVYATVSTTARNAGGVVNLHQGGGLWLTTPGAVNRVRIFNSNSSTWGVGARCSVYVSFN